MGVASCGIVYFQGERAQGRGNQGHPVVVAKVSEVWQITDFNKSGRGQTLTKIKPTLDWKSGNVRSDSMNSSVRQSTEIKRKI